MLILAIEVLLAFCVLLTTWFVGYVVYRLVTDEQR
ncbi:membrane protein [Rhodococcus sp. Chr-9]|nr:membrane protein [Rhodococcus sp. Chr-9]